MKLKVLRGVVVPDLKQNKHLINEIHHYGPTLLNVSCETDEDE